MCCDSRGHRESDTTERLNWTTYACSDFQAPSPCTNVKNVFLPSSCYREGSFHMGILLPISETKGEGGGQNDLLTSAIFSNSFSFRYLICQSNILWSSTSSTSSKAAARRWTIEKVLSRKGGYCENKLGMFVWESSTTVETKRPTKEQLQ